MKKASTGLQEFDGFVTNPLLILSTAWTPTSLNTLIYNDLFETYVSLSRTNAYLYDKLKRFMFVEGKLRVTIVAQGTAAAQGKLIISFEPRPYSPALGTSVVPYPQFTRGLLLPHIEIDPAKSATYTIDLVPTSPFGVFSLADHGGKYAGSYSVKQHVLNPLGSGTAAAPQVGLAFYLSLVDPIFHSATSSTIFTSSKEELTQNEGGILSSFLTKASDLSSSVSALPIPFISEPAHLFSAATGAAAKFFKWFGFAKPIAVDIQPVNISAQNQLSMLDGKLVADRLCLRSNNSIGLSPDLCPLLKYEDMVCSELAKKWGLVSINTFTSAALPNVPILYHYVSPGSQLVLSDPAITGYYELTPLGYVAAPYLNWRGEITYKAQFVCSAFHRATVLIIHEPLSTGSMTDPIAKASLLQSWTVNISGNTELEFTVPWRQMQPYLGVKFGSISSIHNNGTLIFCLINPVTSNGSTDPIYMNLYHKCEELYLGDQQMPLVQFTSGESPNEFYLKFFGEEPAHTVKELAARPTQEVSFFFSSGLGTQRLIFEQSPEICYLKSTIYPATTGTSVDARVTLYEFLASAFVGVRGATNFSAIINGGGCSSTSVMCTKTDGASTYVVPTVSTYNTSNFSDVKLQGFSTKPGTIASNAVVVLPYTNSGSYRLTYMDSLLNGDSSDTVKWKLFTSGTSAAVTDAVFMKSAAEDTLFVGFRGVPPVKFL